MRKQKHLLALLLALTLLLGLLAGCAPKEEAPANSPAASDAEPLAEPSPAVTAPEAPASEAPAPPPEAPPSDAQPAPEEEASMDFSQQPMVSLPIENDGHTHTVWIGGLNRDAPISQWDENYAIKQWIARTGVSMSFDEIAPPTMSEKFNIMIASQDYADVLSEATSLYAGGGEAMVQEEILIDLAPYLEQYAPSYSWLRQNDKAFAADTVTNSGMITEFYGYAYNVLGATSGLVVRGDWLDSLGLEVPKTYDGFHDMLFAVKSAGLCDSPLAVLYSGVTGGAFLEGGCGVPQLGSGVSAWGVMDGALAFIPTSGQFKDYLTMLKAWYAEGLIYPDLLKNNMHSSATILNNGYGVFFEVGEFLSNYERQASDPAFKLVPMTHLAKGDDGQKIASGSMPRAKQGSAWSVSTRCENPEAVISAIDYLFSVEGGYLAAYGIQGKTWDYDEAGKPAYTDFTLNNPDGWTYSTVTQVYCINIPGILGDQSKYLQTYTDTQIEAATIWLENVVGSENDNRGLWTMTVDENTEFANLMADVSTYVSEMLPKFLTGAADMDGAWEEYCRTVEGMNIGRSTELVQAARERYNKRVAG